MTKGHADDMLGLLEPVDWEDEEVLTCFDLYSHHLNRTAARYIVQDLLSDPKNIEEWESFQDSRKSF